MSSICPKCQCDRIGMKNLARKAGGTIGTLAGATHVAAGVLRSTDSGMITAPTAGPRYMPYGSIASAILGGLLGGATGCVVGARLGVAVDSHILNNLHCLSCGYTFSQQQS